MTTPTITPSAIQQQLHKAQALDSDNMTQAAFAEYAKCVSMIGTALGSGAIKSQTVGKLIYLCELSLDRLADLSGQPPSQNRLRQLQQQQQQQDMSQSSLEAEFERFMAEGSTSSSSTVTVGNSNKVQTQAQTQAQTQVQALPLIRPSPSAPPMPSSSTAVAAGVLQQYSIYPAPVYEIPAGEAKLVEIPPSPLLAFRGKTIAWLQAAQQRMDNYNNKQQGATADLAMIRKLREDLGIMKARLDNVDKEIARAVNLTMVDMKPEDVTAQLSLITFGLYTSVSYKDLQFLLDGNVMAAPRLLNLMLFMRYIRNWVVAECVLGTDVTQRAQCISQFVLLARLCLDMGNFEAGVAIVTGLKAPAIIRLQKTWSAVPRKLQQTLEQMVQLTSVAGRYDMLRKAMAQGMNASSAVQPYAGLLVDDVMFAKANYDMGTGTLSEPGLRITSAVQETLTRTILSPYKFPEDLHIQHYILTRVQYTEVDSFELSLLREVPPPTEVVSSERSCNTVYDYYLQLHEDQIQPAPPSYNDTMITSQLPGNADSTHNGDLSAGSEKQASSFMFETTLSGPSTSTTHPPQSTNDDLEERLRRLMEGGGGSSSGVPMSPPIITSPSTGSELNTELLLSQLPEVPTSSSSWFGGGSSAGPAFTVSLGPVPNPVTNTTTSSAEDDMDALFARLNRLQGK